MASKKRTNKYIVTATIRMQSKKLPYASAQKLKTDIKRKSPGATVSVRKV